MFISSTIVYLLFIVDVDSSASVSDGDLLSDPVASKIMSYVSENHFPLVLTEKITGPDAGSMSTVFYGYLQSTTGSMTPVVVKYASFKSLWNYIHLSDIDRLLFNHQFSPCDEKPSEATNEYLVFKEDKNRILNEGLVPSELYVALKAYKCPHLMPTSTVVSLQYSYGSFFRSVEQEDEQRTFFIIFARLRNGISLHAFVQQFSHQISIQSAKFWIHAILMAVFKLKAMSILHLDLNSGNIFLMNSDMQHPVRFIDFAIMQFIHKPSDQHIMYSSILHKSLRSIYTNCPTCSDHSSQAPLFAYEFDSSLASWSIDQIIQHPWFYAPSNHPGSQK